MTDDLESLIQGYLDGILSPEQEADLSNWIKASPANANAFARAVRLHDRLGNLIRSGLPFAPAVPASDSQVPQGNAKIPRRGWRPAAMAGALTGVAAVIVVGMWWVWSAPASAATELARLIATCADSGDRTYLIRNLDDDPEQADDRRPPIDGATLHVRRPDKYVLVRRFPDGRPFVTGSDGVRAWAIPPRGVVRVSNDPLRFRGPVPGQQHGIPFVDLRSDLVQLREAYFLSVLEPQANGWRGLLANRKSPEHRGPRRIELWYDPLSRVVQRMVFDGMPQARGGPKSVAVELVEQRDLGDGFFQHESHHELGRRVIEEN